MRTVILLLIYLAINPIFAEKLLVGTDPFLPPFEIAMDDKNNFTGFDIELMMLICQRIQADCSFKQIKFAQLFPQIQSGKIDLAISAISITEEREKNHLFSLPYFLSNSQFLTNAASNINTMNDIRGKRAGVEQRTVGLDLINSRFHDASVTVVEFPTTQSLLLALSDEKVDVILLASETAHYWAANNNLLKLIDMPMPDGHGYGIMTNLNNTSLINRINNALLSIQNDGTYQHLYKHYFTYFHPG